MDNLKSLTDRGDYQLTLDLTVGAPDPESRFYRLKALIGLNKPKEALSLIKEGGEKLFEYSPLAILKADFSIRFLLHQFDEAYEDLDAFSNYPYMSQEVEEALRAYPTIIRRQEKDFLLAGKSSDLDLEEALKKGLDDYEVLGLLGALKGEAIKENLPTIRKIALSGRHDEVKTFALFLLIAGQDKEEITIKKHGVAYKVVPAKCPAPFSGPSYLEVTKALESNVNDPSLSRTARGLLDQLIIAEYPVDPLKGGPEKRKALTWGLLLLAAEYLHSDLELATAIAKAGVDLSSAQAQKEAVADVLAEEEPLHY